MRRLQLVFAAIAVALCVAVPASAQSARATGMVRDTAGHAIRSAIVRAVNQDARPSEVTSTTDDKGRFAMIGLMSGTWTFIAEAPGFLAQRADVPVRVGAEAVDPRLPSITVSGDESGAAAWNWQRRDRAKNQPAHGDQLLHRRSLSSHSQ